MAKIHILGILILLLFSQCIPTEYYFSPETDTIIEKYIQAEHIFNNDTGDTLRLTLKEKNDYTEKVHEGYCGDCCYRCRLENIELIFESTDKSIRIKYHFKFRQGINGSVGEGLEVIIDEMIMHIMIPNIRHVPHKLENWTYIPDMEINGFKYWDVYNKGDIYFQMEYGVIHFSKNGKEWLRL